MRPRDRLIICQAVHCWWVSLLYYQRLHRSRVFFRVPLTRGFSRFPQMESLLADVRQTSWLCTAWAWPQKVARALAGDWTRNDRVEILGPRLSKVRVIDPWLFQLSPWTSEVKYGGTTCLGNYEPPARKGQFVVRMTKPCLVFADSNLCISQLNPGSPTPGAWLGIAGI